MKTNKIHFIVAIFFMISLFSTSAFALADNEVKSRHIDDDAVKSRHIADDAIKARHIEDDAVRSRHIVDDAIKARHINNGAVNTNKIADGAVTDVKITGPISGSKIDPTGLDADTVDGAHAAELEESAEIDADIAAHTTPSAHHAKTMSFTELTDQATDAQIPHGPQ